MNPNKPGRYLRKWFIATVVHLMTSIALGWIGFVYGMRAFNESGAGEVARILWRIQSFLNFPVVLIRRQFELTPHGRDNIGLWDHPLGPYPSLISLLWSLIFGLLFAMAWVCFSRTGQIPSQATPAGLQA